MNRNLVLWVLATLALAAGIFFAAQQLMFQHIARAQVKATPFTLEMESYEFSDGLPETLIAKETVARRSDGATARVDSMGGIVGLQAGETERHILYLDGHALDVFDGVQSVVRFPQLSLKAMAFRKEEIVSPPENCVFLGDSLVGYGTIRGYKVAKVKNMAIGQRTVTAWLAPELGCEQLQYQVEENEADGTTKVTSETRAVSLVTGEPDPKFFDVPDSYNSVQPSLALRKEADKLGAPWNDAMQQEATRADAAYWGVKPPKTP